MDQIVKIHKPNKKLTSENDGLAYFLNQTPYKIISVYSSTQEMVYLALARIKGEIYSNKS
jgi:aminoglycoside phosphotransferase